MEDWRMEKWRMEKGEMEDWSFGIRMSCGWLDGRYGRR